MRQITFCIATKAKHWRSSSRDPAALYRDLGPKGFWVLQILLIGMIGSAIAHPLFLILLGKAIALVLYGRSTDLWMDVLLALQKRPGRRGLIDKFRDGNALLRFDGMKAGKRLGRQRNHH